MNCKKIAIDGPAVSGKSSAAKHLAHRLGYLYLDSGAIYRSITLASRRGFHMDGEDLMTRLDALGIRLEPSPSGIGCNVFMGEENVSHAIRDEDVTNHILPISGNEEIRVWVTDYLRDAAKRSDVVMDGRDIASVVFPDADHKFFVTASLDARTKRRMNDLDQRNQPLPYDDIYTMLEKRDVGDRSRKVGPLLQTEDAIEIDNSNLNLEETVECMLKHISESCVMEEV